MKYLFLIVSFSFCCSAFSQTSKNTYHISEDIEIVRVSENVYMHTSYKDSERWGRIPANGLIYINKKKAFLFDTPWEEAQTESLISWVEDSLRVKIVGFIPNHWHVDCMGGIKVIEDKNIKSFANQMTIDTAKNRGLSAPENGFKDSLELKLNRKKVTCYYLGAAHTFDNIVVWLPSEQLLFAGCVLKGLEYNNIGFIDDGDINEYPNTLKRVLTKFPDAKIVVPGHGNYGGKEIIHHNLKILN